MIFNIPPLCKKPFTIFNPQDELVFLGDGDDYDSCTFAYQTSFVYEESNEKYIVRGLWVSGDSLFLEFGSYVKIPVDNDRDSNDYGQGNIYINKEINCSTLSKIEIEAVSTTYRSDLGDSKCYACVFPDTEEDSEGWMFETCLKKVEIPLYEEDNSPNGECYKPLEKLTIDVKDVHGKIKVGFFEHRGSGEYVNRTFNLYIGNIIAI